MLADLFFFGRFFCLEGVVLEGLRPQLELFAEEIYRLQQCVSLFTEDCDVFLEAVADVVVEGELGGDAQLVLRAEDLQLLKQFVGLKQHVPHRHQVRHLQLLHRQHLQSFALHFLSP